MPKGTVRLRALEVDLKARIARGEAEEAKHLKRVEQLRASEEELRGCRAHLKMLREWQATLEEKDSAPREELPVAD